MTSRLDEKDPAGIGGSSSWCFVHLPTKGPRFSMMQNYLTFAPMGDK
jgi:hypothetical protein